MDLTDSNYIEPMKLLVPKIEPIDPMFIKEEEDHFVLPGIVENIKIEDENLIKKESIKTEDIFRPMSSSSSFVSQYQHFGSGRTLLSSVLLYPLVV